MARAQLERLHPHAAGIDIGSEEIYVSVDGEEVKRFATFTASYEQASEYLRSRGITTVAMESTGVYWVALYEMLERAGFDVCLVSSSYVKHLPGRKSDVVDCQWLQQLHTYGLLKRSFIPPEAIRRLRTYVRLRDDHIAMAAQHIQHMQKALDQMNIKLHTVLSQLTGVSGMRMVKAILAGERDPERLLALCETTIVRTKRAPLLAALHGCYADDHLFALAQAVECWEFYQRQMLQCENEIERALQQMSDHLPPPELQSDAKPTRHHQPDIDDLHGHLMRLTGGNNPSAITGLTDVTVLKVIAETGTDLSPWPVDKRFTAWLGLAPIKHGSGKRPQQHAHIRVNTRAGQLFRTAAQSLATSKHSALGAFYRRIKARRGPRIAMKALARKLALMFYYTMTQGTVYVEQGIDRYQQHYQQQLRRRLERQARALGFALVPTHGPST